jgi:hypothetical protein
MMSEPIDIPIIDTIIELEEQSEKIFWISQTSLSCIF